MTDFTSTSATSSRASRALSMRRGALVLLASVLPLACDDDPMPPDACGTVGLPVRGASSAPAVTDVTLEVQPIVVVLFATATDPQGSDDLNNIVQTVHVFRDRECEGGSIMLQDDVVGSGVEESFGNVVARGEDAALYDAIAAASTWPVEVDFRDGDGNRTTARVRARVVVPD